MCNIYYSLVYSSAGPLFTKKTPSFGYRDPHYKPKTVWWPSQVFNGNPYTDNMASSWSIEALGYVVGGGDINLTQYLNNSFWLAIVDFSCLLRRFLSRFHLWLNVSALHHHVSFCVDLSKMLLDLVYGTTTGLLSHASFKPFWANLEVSLLVQLGEYTLVPFVTCQGLI